MESATKFSRPGKEGGRRQIEQEELNRYHAGQAPVGPFMFREFERRLDTVIFRACFETSQHNAQKMIQAGHVRLNGNIVSPDHPLTSHLSGRSLMPRLSSSRSRLQERDYNIRMLPGDFIEINPAAVRFLRRPGRTQVALAGSRSTGIDYDLLEGKRILIRKVVGIRDEGQVEEILEKGTYGGMTIKEWAKSEKWSEEKTKELTDGLAAEPQPVEDPVEVQEAAELESDQRDEPDVEPTESAGPNDAAVEDGAAVVDTPTSELPQNAWPEKPRFPADADDQPTPSSILSLKIRPLNRRGPNEEMEPATPTHFPPLRADPPGTKHFHLPAYCGPSLFVPQYLQPNWEYCTLTYLRHPAARHNYCEIPSPFNPKGDAMKATWEYYQGRKIRMKTYTGGLFPGGIDSRARLGKIRKGPEIRRAGVHEDFY